jgi:hypothetical protein
LFLETTEKGGIFENEYGEPSDCLRLRYWWDTRQEKFVVDQKLLKKINQRKVRGE